jgi:hypothetical protein
MDIAKEPLSEAVALIGHDKKRAGKQLKFVVAHAPGDVRTTEVELSELSRLTLELARA